MAAAVATAAADSGARNEEKTPAALVVGTPSPSKPPPSPQDEIKAVARKLTDRPLQNPDPGVWGVLTAISKNARQRLQGITIILNGDEHSFGRLVEDSRFQIGDSSISANHCKIIRRTVTCGDDEECLESSVYAFLKDTSTNGTYHNWKKMRKRSPEVRLQHGDIISFVHAPHEENAYAFVYREVHNSTDPRNDMNLKRKSEDFATESKRTKGIGIGSVEGPVSLDDVRSLQRSNTELRKQLESRVETIEELRSNIRASNTNHENDLKKLKETISSSYINQFKEIQGVLDLKQQELSELNTAFLMSQNSAKDLNERVTALMQSRSDADEIINSQKYRISELETQLDEERNQRREERDKAAVVLKSALQRVQTEAQEEIKRQAEVYSRQNREQEELLFKLQETEKENRLLLDTLRSKLEDTRENLVVSDKKVRQLESQVQEEKISSENGRKRADTLELEIKSLKKELEVEKQVAREEAWTKVSALELEIAAAMHELSIEKQRFQGARERIILRETQLRAFYSTTEEISALFTKQQEQLKAMQKTLEDEENGEYMTVGFDLNSCPDDNVNEAFEGKRGKMAPSNDPKDVPGSSNSGKAALLVVSSSDDDSVTEKHDCDIGSQEDNNTQDLECTSAGRSAKAFGSEIDGVETAPIADENLLDTEQVQETESPMADNGLVETMQLDNETQVQNNTEEIRGVENRNDGFSQSRFEDTEPGTIRTSDLLASEVPGSWANSTAPSVHGENDSPRSTDSAGGNCNNAEGASDGLADGSQTNAAVSGRARYSEQHCALTTMIGIVAPELKGQFRTGRSSDEKNESMSDAETEEGSHLNADGSGSEDSEEEVASVNGNDDVMIEDSVG